MKQVYITRSNNASYSQECVNQMVEKLLHAMHYDDEHYGTAEWNPLATVISKDDTVLIKPNLVMHYNENKEVTENSMECLVTQTQCIKSICDFCILALKGTGKIIIGDAPMQGCNFLLLTERIGLSALVNEYQKQGICVSLIDFREYQSDVNSNAVLTDKKYTDSVGVLVHLGSQSMHCQVASNEKYQVSDYAAKETEEMHHGQVHDYYITKDVLTANVIINMCKPKTHRLAGFTGAMKNLVGCVYNKACLPHRKAGSVEEGGDAYLYKNVWKRMAEKALLRKIKAEEKGHLFAATVLRYVYATELVIGKKVGKDKFFIGSWYGNDTIWRTVCDLNYIVKYANADGRLCEEPQRYILSIGDMIICGEGNGPVKPSPKRLGMLMASDNVEAFDLVLCKIMGFDVNYIPLTRHLAAKNTEQIVIIDNDSPRLYNNFVEPRDWHFTPYETWKD